MDFKIVFLDRSSLIATRRAPAFVHTWIDYDQTEPDDVPARIRDADAVVTNKVALRADALAQAARLKFIAAAATGTDHIDLDWCRSHDITVSNIRGYATHAVPEHAFMMILALRRNLLGWQDDVRAGRWQQSDQFCLFTRQINDIHGSTLGLIGYGALGKGMQRLAEAFGMRVLIAEHKHVATPRSGRTAFDAVIREADVISLHAPLTPDTHHMISTREFGLMKPTALLINTARGKLVDEAALAEALTTQRIAGAGFDVLSSEPPSADHPLLALELPNFILTPHVSWSSREAMQSLADQLVDNIEGFVAGAPRNRVV